LQPVVLVQANNSIPVNDSSFQPLATVVVRSGDVTDKRTGNTFFIKLRDSILTCDEVNACAKPVTLHWYHELCEWRRMT
jgi:hypothetical protein